MADPICENLHLSRSWFFGIFSASLLLSGLLRPVAGRMIDRIEVVMCWPAPIWFLQRGWCSWRLLRASGGLSLAWVVIGIGMGFGLYEAAFATVAALAAMPAMPSPALRYSPGSPARLAGPQVLCSWTRSAGAEPA
jgi:hypothetical protein